MLLLRLPVPLTGGCGVVVDGVLGAKALGSTEGRSGTQGSEQDEDDGEEENEQREEEEEGGEEGKGPALDWMGRIRDQGSPPESVAVLSPFAAARRERILVLPGWFRALKPWGDFLQVTRLLSYENPVIVNKWYLAL